MGTMIDEAITRYKNNAEYERTHGNLQGCLEFRQLVKWLEQLQKIDQIVKSWNVIKSFDSMIQIREILKDEKDD